MQITEPEEKSIVFINILSIVVPAVVALLIGIPTKLDFGEWTKNLPHIIGTINTFATLALIAGLIFIRYGKINWHRAAMTTAFVLGVFFLVCYVIYHISNPPRRFSGEGVLRYVYFFVLLSHIGLSILVLPLVLRAMFFALTNQFVKHRRVVRFAYPIWLYVSITGVMVYLMAYHL